jgi:transcriptional regulator with XRE-family HTH domain
VQSQQQAVLPIAQNLRRVRQQKKLSLSALAREANVSKSTLSQLERGYGNPSIETLWSIAQALDAPLAALFDEPETDGLQITRFEDTAVVARTGDAYRRSSAIGDAVLRHLTSWQHVRELELYAFDLADGAVWNAAGHSQGVVEHTVVVRGQVEIGEAGSEVVLNEGDQIRFPADRPHRYRVVQGPARLFVTLAYPAR